MMRFSAFNLPAINLISTPFIKIFGKYSSIWNAIAFSGMRALSTGTPPPRLPIEILESDIEEKFVKGSGPGGQKSIKFVMNLMDLDSI